MSATPRTMRSVAVPAPPQFRRVARVNTRPFGTITLFLAATGILGVTSLCYVWQAGLRTSSGYQIQALQAQLTSLQNTRADLQSRIEALKSPDVVAAAARTKYGMQMPTDPSVVTEITVPGPLIVTYKYVPVSVAAAGPSVRVQATNAAVTSWWQDAWVALYKLLR